MYNEIINTIKSALTEYAEENKHRNWWKEPLIEIIPADDEKIISLKKIVSSDHLLPHDILPEAQSIISFFIPYHEDIVKSNIDGTMASQQWAAAYIGTNELIKHISDTIEKLMERNGYKTGKIPATHNFNAKTLMSNWSHRHVAYIAGLGTFGINNMLITKNGCCGRFGSIIISCKLEEYREINALKEKCLHKLNGSCGICQKKCVVNAYENNFNRFTCYTQCLKNGELHRALGLADVCGKCLVGLPCSTTEPR